MLKIADPVTQWALLILISVVMGTLLLIGVAFFRRWQQTRYVRYVHDLRRKYRPALAKLLSGARDPCAMEALRKLPLPTLELLLDPLFSKRKLPERCLVSLRAFCAELGLADLWQARLANGRQARNGGRHASTDRAVLSYLLRAKSIRNLGILRHQRSWPLLVQVLDDRHPDIQLVALRSLAALGAPDSFPALRERLQAVVQKKYALPPLAALKAAMANFDLTCASSLLSLLRKPDRQVRLQATDVLRTMVSREAARQPGLALDEERLTPELVELLVSGLPLDPDAEIRARAAEILVFVTDPRVAPVLRGLLLDQQWFVRLRSVRALAHPRQPAARLYHDIRGRLCDMHWRVREAAIETLISLGPQGQQHLCDHFLTSTDLSAHEQIVEIMERQGLMSGFLEQCAAYTEADATVVEPLAGEAALRGLQGVLHVLTPETRRKLLDRLKSRLPLPRKGEPREMVTRFSTSRPLAA